MGRARAFRTALVPLALALAHPDAVGQTASQGVAIGGNVSGSTITVGITPKSAEALVQAATAKWKNLSAEQRNQLRELERELGVTSGALQTFFAVLGENDVESGLLPVRLGQIASQHLALKAQLAASAGDPSETAQLKEAARAALDAGKLDEADGLLRKIEGLQEASLEGQLKERIKTAEQRATLAKSRLRYKDAAAQYVVAERYAANDAAKAEYRRERVRALLEQAAEFDDAAAQREGIALLRQSASTFDRATDPAKWASTRRDLGYALVYRGVENATAAEVDEAMRLLGEMQDAHSALTDTEQIVENMTIYGQVLCNAGEVRGDKALIRSGADKLGDAMKVSLEHGGTAEAAMISISRSTCLADGDTPTYDLDTARALRLYFFELSQKIDKGKQPFEWFEAIMGVATMNAVIGRQTKSPRAMALAVDYSLIGLSVITAEGSPEKWESGVLALTTALIELSELSLSVAPLELAIEKLEAFLAAGSGRTAAERNQLGLQLAQARLDLALARDDPAAVRAAIDDLTARGASPDGLPAEMRGDLADSIAWAKAWLAKPREAPSVADPTGKKTTLALIQLTLPIAQPADAEARTAAFSQAIKGIRHCRDGLAVAEKLGAKTTITDSLGAEQLPPVLRDALANTAIGSSSMAFGEAGKEIRALVLCGRRITPAGAAPAPAPAATN